MTEPKQAGRLKRKRIWQILAALAVLLAVLIVPPLVGVSRYKSRITRLISTSLGRPVRLSSVEVRLLPVPGFVLTDLTVPEDPAFGAEPVLHANTVKASIRLFSLWRGRLEIGTISVDEASLNLVRSPAGRWNLDSLFRNAAAQPGSGPNRASAPLPYLEATNSRINIKRGAEKLPFSLVNADLSFWQQNPGEWRLRLRGQPARTDLTLGLADTGIVRLEASLHQAAQLRQMPAHIDIEWRDAQLGQLTRLLLGSDSGWRGDLTGELHLDGTAETAQIKTRLRAIGVHREEFAPAAPMDFDANCGLVSHFSMRAAENIVCDSQLGQGRIRIAGAIPAEAGQPHLSVELDRIPAAALLDALRTVRSGLGAGLEARGTASGKLTYASEAEPASTSEKPLRALKSRAARYRPAIVGPLTGSIAVDGLEISGGGLTEPVRLPKLLLEPAAGEPSGPRYLTSTASIPAGASTPLAVAARLGLDGYQITVRGQASVARARELARMAGMADAAPLDALAGDPLSVDLTAVGPWMPAQRLPFGVPAASEDLLSGTVTLHNANWKADFLANHVEISQATLHLGPGELRWDPIAFTYGPVKGTAVLTLPAPCVAPTTCPPRFELQFGVLDAAVLQAAFLGAHAPGTMLSTLIDRLRPTAAPPWPELEVTVKADSLVLGPLTLRAPTAMLRTKADGAGISGFDASLLGGAIHGSGSFKAAATPKDKPIYQLEGHFEKLNPQAVGQLVGQRWSGGPLDGDGKLELAGFTGSDLAGSASGTLHFEWQHGAISGPGAVPAVLSRFDHWVADAEIAHGALTLKDNQVKRGSAVTPVQASVPLAESPRVAFAPLKQATPKPSGKR